MSTYHQHGSSSGNPQSFWRTPGGTVLTVFLAVAGLLLVFEHRAHIFGDWLLFLPLLICIGMHFFMHGNHGGHGHSHHSDHDGDDDAR